MKKFLIFSGVVITILIAACNKTTNLPVYTPPVATNFSVKSLVHTKDTVSVGDTIYLTASGTMSDTTMAIYGYLTISSTASGASTLFTYGTSAAPLTIQRTIGANTNGLYAWTATIPLYTASLVPHKSKLTVTANFQYQLSLSSEQGTLTATDAGIKNKTIFVQ